jgi:PAS domain S-box-containing protein
MRFRDLPIRRKLMTIILLTSGSVTILTCASFLAYEFYTFRERMIRQLNTLGEIIATNSTAALAFDSQDDAQEILSALKAEPHVVAAALYDKNGKLFARYPATGDTTEFPTAPATEQGYRFDHEYLSGFQPVVVSNKTLGSLYIRSDMDAINERFRLYAVISLFAIVASFITAYFISFNLQRTISYPILQLAVTARAISDRNDYAVRAPKLASGEIGLLTDAFNNMLDQIHLQNQALMESGEKMRAVLNAAMSAVVVIDQSGRITDWNERAELIFGWTREEVVGRELIDTIIPPAFRDQHRHGLRRYLQSGIGPVLNTVIEVTALRRNGDEFPVDLSVSPLKTGDTVSFCGFITDITERKHAEERLRQFNQELERMVKDRTAELEFANKELEAFSYSVSHDLRAPLRSIHGYMNIFSEDYAMQLDDEAKRLMTIIENNAKRMGQLIDDLLAFSKLGRKELMKSRISMQDMAMNTWEDLKKNEGQRTVKLIMHPLPEAYADNSTLRQVWINLLSNALKYTRHQENAVVEIGCDEIGPFNRYFVRDNGAGFDMQFYDKLFGVFQRLHSNKEFEGTGVGLAIVQRILLKHGGRIWAEAKVNEGATFYFTLPIAIPG